MMADNKEQSPFMMNGGYGSSIPPPYNQSRSSNCCGCFLKFLITIIIILGFAILLFYLIVHPRPFKFYVTNANLTIFNYNPNQKTLEYNLVLNFTARNPNKRLNFYYDSVEANAFYQDSRFSLIDVINSENSFRQYPKSTNQLSGVFKGQQYLYLDESQLSEFDLEKNHGVFSFYVRLDFNIRFRLGRFITNEAKAKAKCWPIKVALSDDGKIVSPFEPIECNVKEG